MLTVTDLSVRYGMHEALLSVGLTVDRDEIVVILGANGAGKSTLLSAIAGNCAGDVDGEITLDGEHLLGLNTAQVVENGIAYVPEGRGVFSDLSVEENLQLGSYTEHARQSESENLSRVFSLFPKLQERKKQIVRTMSGGEQQMVAVGRALMSAPSILMLDEPSLGLSPLLCKELFSSLKQVRDTGVGILLVEQNAKQSLSISDRGYLLGNGKIIGQDSAASLLNDPAVQAAYLGGAMGDHSASAPTAKSSEPIIRPAGVGVAAETKSSNSLLDENIDALVARASSVATRNQAGVDQQPLSIVKLSADTAPKHIEPTRNPEQDLPITQDTKVQALLAEFEAAAKKAASGSKPIPAGKTSVLSSAETDHTQDSLPHIPVYKKSEVTVYRRGSDGKLRKQDKP